MYLPECPPSPPATSLPHKPSIHGSRQWRWCDGPQSYFVSGDCSDTQYDWEIIGDTSDNITMEHNNDTATLLAKNTGTYSLVVHKYGVCRTQTDTLHFTII